MGCIESAVLKIRKEECPSTFFFRGGGVLFIAH